MSLLLIGFGKTTRRDFGPTGHIQECIWCRADTIYHLMRVRTWFTYFFIPVIPYRRRYYLECPYCGGAIAISGDEIGAAKRGEVIIRREFIG